MPALGSQASNSVRAAVLGPQCTGVAQIRAPSLVERGGAESWGLMSSSGLRPSSLDMPCSWWKGGRRGAGSAQASSVAWLARGDAGPLGEPAGWARVPVGACLAGLSSVTLFLLLLGRGLGLSKGRALSGTVHQGNPRAVLEVSLETTGVLTTRSLVGVPALQMPLLGGGPRAWEGRAGAQ